MTAHLSTYPPELLRFYELAALSPTSVDMSLKMANATRAKLHRLRESLRDANHDLYVLAAGVTISIVVVGEKKAADVIAGDQTVRLVGVPNLDHPMVQALRNAGVKGEELEIEQSPPELPSPTPSPSPTKADLPSETPSSEDIARALEGL